MNCYTCVYKHISGALSYAKEIIAGHGKGAELDHRIDFIGELVNLEHHLELVDSGLFQELRNYRESITEKHVQIDESDLQFLRDLFIKIENFETGNEIKAINQNAILDDIDIIYHKVENMEHFKLSLASVQKHLKHIKNIYVLSDKIEEFAGISGINLVNLNLIDFVNQNESENFAVISENCVILKQTDSRNIPPTFCNQKIDVQTLSFLKQRNIVNYKNFDNRKIQIINKEKFIQSNKDYVGDFPLTVYFNSFNIHSVNELQYIVSINGKICCSNKSNLKIRNFAVYSDSGFEHLKNYLDENQK